MPASPPYNLDWNNCLDTLQQQLQFLREIDRLKTVIRQSPLLDKSRRENSAEHSWHLAMYAIVLAAHANEPVQVDRVIKMLLIHDIVEIDAGDLPFYANADFSAQEEREAAAANRLFGMLPTDQATELHSLWKEFEAAETADAKFAKTLDRLQPVLHNAATDGGTWNTFPVDLNIVKNRVGPPIERGSKALWAHAQDLIEAHFSAKT